MKELLPEDHPFWFRYQRFTTQRMTTTSTSELKWSDATVFGSTTDHLQSVLDNGPPSEFLTREAHYWKGRLLIYCLVEGSSDAESESYVTYSKEIQGEGSGSDRDSLTNVSSIVDFEIDTVGNDQGSGQDVDSINNDTVSS